MRRTRRKTVTATSTVVDRYKRRKKIKMRGTFEYVPYPSQEARDEAFRKFVEASLKGIENRIKHERTSDKNQEEKRRAGETESEKGRNLE